MLGQLWTRTLCCKDVWIFVGRVGSHRQVQEPEEDQHLGQFHSWYTRSRSSYRYPELQFQRWATQKVCGSWVLGLPWYWWLRESGAYCCGLGRWPTDSTGREPIPRQGIAICRGSVPASSQKHLRRAWWRFARRQPADHWCSYPRNDRHSGQVC